MSVDGDKQLVEALANVEEGLISWELDFCESVSEQVENGRALTTAQRDKIESILERLGK